MDVQFEFKESAPCVTTSFFLLFFCLNANQWDQRLLTLDPLSVAHVLKNSTIYEKPWQSRRLISGLIGCGMLAAEGEVHKRQRRVATAAFSVQNMRSLVPIVFKKGMELRDTWFDILRQSDTPSCKIDICHWISRATFDVIGLAGLCLLTSIRHNL